MAEKVQKTKNKNRKTLMIEQSGCVVKIQKKNLNLID